MVNLKTDLNEMTVFDIEKANEWFGYTFDINDGMITGFTDEKKARRIHGTKEGR
ncbi:MAG: hypothetical protein IIZ29_04165 [Schwartzia sp.]|nr:hypothetical protein [Schwartzia sp. (in: firmicutes)]